MNERNPSHHCVLIIKLNDNNGRVVPQLAGLSKQLHVLKNQQLVPRGAQRLRQHLRARPHLWSDGEGGGTTVRLRMRGADLCDLALCGEEDSGEGVRQTRAVGSKQAASLVHVDSQLEDLLHWGRNKENLSVYSLYSILERE